MLASIGFDDGVAVRHNGGQYGLCALGLSSAISVSGCSSAMVVAGWDDIRGDEGIAGHRRKSFYFRPFAFHALLRTT